jgi:hypothetical protein
MSKIGWKENNSLFEILFCDPFSDCPIVIIDTVALGVVKYCTLKLMSFKNSQRKEIQYVMLGWIGACMDSINLQDCRDFVSVKAVIKNAAKFFVHDSKMLMCFGTYIVLMISLLKMHLWTHVASFMWHQHKSQSI